MRFLKSLARSSIRFGECVGGLLFGPRFTLTGDSFDYPHVGPGCSFSFARNIVCHPRVQFHKGSCILADPNGKIVLYSGVTICRFAILQSVGGTLAIGEYSLVGDHCNLYAQGNLSIGRKVMIASGCRIVPNQHTFEQPFLPVGDQPCKSLGIEIHDGAWLGANVIVLDGVTIGNGAVVGAGSVRCD